MTEDRDTFVHPDLLELTRIGITHLNSGELTEALSTFASVLKHSPNFTPALQYQGICKCEMLVRQGLRRIELTDAISDFKIVASSLMKECEDSSQ